MLSVVDRVRKQHLDYLDAVMAATGLNRSQLASRAGVDPSTLTKFANDSAGIARLSTDSLAKIEGFAGFAPGEQGRAPRPRGLAEAEAAPFQPTGGAEAAAIVAWKAGRNGLDPWILQSRALENAGYVEGDILMVDLNETPKSGDIVCAQVYDRAGRAETVMRIYEHPFLVSATHDRNLFRPLLVDDDRVQLRGVVIGSLRPRRAAA